MLGFARLRHFGLAGAGVLDLLRSRRAPGVGRDCRIDEEE